MSIKELINSLLYEEEGTTLDFKSEQYKFVKAEDKEKAELLKDILAFSNAWRRSDAYILIGVKEVKGGKSLVDGVSDDLDDAQLQQFIQSKINRPINFSYLTTEIEGKKVAVISIPVQNRPIFLKKDYGKLTANTVYVRRGSSTEVALPDEIAEMGSSDNAEIKKAPKLKAFIAKGEHDEIRQSSINEIVTLAKIPGKSAFPEYGEPPKLDRYGVPNISMSLLEGYNREYYSELAEFYKEFKSIFTLKVGVENNGNKVARDVRVALNIQGLPEGSIIYHEREFPERPKPKKLLPALHNLYKVPSVYNLSIKTIPSGYRADINFGKIQSKDSQICSEILCFKITESCQFLAKLTIYSDDLDNPEKLKIPITIDVKEKGYSVREIIKLANGGKLD